MTAVEDIIHLGTTIHDLTLSSDIESSGRLIVSTQRVTVHIDVLVALRVSQILPVERTPFRREIQDIIVIKLCMFPRDQRGVTVLHLEGDVDRVFVLISVIERDRLMIVVGLRLIVRSAVLAVGTGINMVIYVDDTAGSCSGFMIGYGTHNSGSTEP